MTDIIPKIQALPSTLPVDHYENFPDRFEVAYRLEFEAFFRTLAEGRTPTPGPEDALETLRLALAAKRSWLEGRPVRLDEVTADKVPE